MNSKTILFYGQNTFDNVLDKVPADHVEDSGVCGEWSVKDIVAHLASYELAFVDILNSFLGRETRGYLERYADISQSFNDTEVEKRKDHSYEDVRSELQEAHKKSLELIEKITEEELREVGTMPWYGEEYSLEDYIVYAVYGHKREHAAQIAVFPDKLDDAKK